MIQTPRAGSTLGDLLLLPGKWADDAACRNDPWPDAYHPSGHAQDAAYMTIYALRTCKACPVRTACLQYAVDVGPAAAQGIYGGTTADQRKGLWRAKGTRR